MKKTILLLISLFLLCFVSVHATKNFTLNNYNFNISNDLNANRLCMDYVCLNQWTDLNTYYYPISTIDSLINNNLTNYVKKIGDNMTGPLNINSFLNASKMITSGNTTSGGDLRLYQDITGTFGNYVDINARYNDMILSSDNGKVVIEDASDINHALAIQEAGVPYGYVSWYFDGSSATGKGAFMEGHYSAPNISMKLGNSQSNSSFRVLSQNNNILFEVRGDGTTSLDNLSTTTSLLENVSIGSSAQFHQNGQCDSRPLISNANTIIYIPRDYDNISDALCDVPILLRHSYRMYIDGNVYNARNIHENITITGIFGFENLDYVEGGTGRLHLVGFNGTPQIDSIYANGITGTQNPWIEKFNVTGISPFDDENDSVGFYGVNQGTIQDIIISGPNKASNVAGNRVVGVLVYGGLSKVMNITFDTNSSRYGFMVKQGGQIWHRDKWSNGETSDSPYWASIGTIWCFMCNLTSSSAETLYKTSQGTIHMSNGEDDSWNTMYGVQIMPRTIFNNTINLDPVSTAVCNQARRGEKYFDKEDNVSYTCSGTIWLQSDLTNNITTKIKMKGYYRNDPDNNYFTVYSDDESFSCDYFCNVTVGVNKCNRAKYFNSIQFDVSGAITCTTENVADKFCQCDN